MNRNMSRRWASILTGALLVVVAGLYFFNVSAKTDDVEKPVIDNLVLGRLAYETVVGSQSGPAPVIRAANADGTGVTALTSWPPYTASPAWSPDGTKIVYIQSEGEADIWVMGSNGSNKTNLSNSAGVAESQPSWSATGKIAYERSGQIWVMNADGTNQIQFAGITQPSPTAPVWSRDGGKLAFVSGGEIWKINADGTNELRVTTNTSTDTDPSWSHDGAKIVFRKGASGIAVINSDGTNEANLTTNPADGTPAWSPDGSTIAFSRAATPSGIYLMDVTGGNQVRTIVDNEGFPIGSTNRNPDWQPVAQTPNTFNISGRLTHSNLSVPGAIVNLSGTVNAATTTDNLGNFQFAGLASGGNYVVSPSALRHYFTPPNRSFNDLAANQIANFEVLGVCIRGRCVKNGKLGFTRGGEIRVMNPDGTGDTNITNNPASDSESEFGADGSLLFTSNRDGNNEIYKMSALNAPPVNLTQNAASDFGARYSPDGKTIVFMTNRDGNLEIYKMNADGSTPVRITNTPTVSEGTPAFMADGRKIIFEMLVPGGPLGMQYRPHTMNLDGSDPQPMPAPGFIAPVPTYEYFDYSPDGSKIIMTYSTDAQTQFRTTWTMDANGTNYVRFPADGKHGTYSPDGTKVVYACCEFNSTNHLKTSDAAGSAGSIVDLTPSTSGNAEADWQPIAAPRPAQFDFDGDSRADISFFREEGGFWYQLLSSGGIIAPQWGLPTDVLTPADYDGDLKTDVAVWRPSDGNFYVLNSFDFSVRIENFGLAGDIPTGGDFDGDGKADVAVYRPGAQGVLYYRASMGNPQRNVSFVSWGLSGDKPVVGDYDGDGRSDVAIYRPSNGAWYILKSSDGQLIATSFGLAADVPVPADYDADGKTDLAVFRGGVWYQLKSLQGFAAFQFGIANDIPVPADYDGDGQADAAIFRNGEWWILKSQSGSVEAVPFGTSGDKPVPAAFVR